MIEKLILLERFPGSRRLQARRVHKSIHEECPIRQEIVDLVGQQHVLQVDLMPFLLLDIDRVWQDGSEPL